MVVGKSDKGAIWTDKKFKTAPQNELHAMELIFQQKVFF